MRNFVLIFTAMLFASIPAGATATTAHTKHKTECPPTHEKVVAANAQAMIYEAPAYREGPGGVFGCAYGSNRSYDLGLVPSGGPSGSGGVVPIALAGKVVAYDKGKTSSLSGRGSHEIWVRNLATGTLIHRMPNGSPAEPGDIGLGETTTIVVKPDGSVAWIVRAGNKQLGGIQVRSVDKTGEHLLAASPEIDPGSLAVAGSTLYWTQGGKPMSAVLN